MIQLNQFMEMMSDRSQHNCEQEAGVSILTAAEFNAVAGGDGVVLDKDGPYVVYNQQL